MMNYYDRTKFSYDRTVRYFRGDEDSFDSSLSLNEMDAEDFNPPHTGMFFKKTYQELLSITHTHCFSTAIVLFILSRILSMVRIKEWVKISTYSLAFAGLGANLGAPWLITFVTPSAVIMLSLSNIALCISFGVYIIIPIYDMWFSKKSSIDMNDNNNP
jgi:hypothetical protein